MSQDESRQEAAARLHEEGVALSDFGDDDGALDRYLRALELDFSRASTHYNVGLIYKYRRAWRDSFRFNRRAHELVPADEAASWNLAIAATALRDWGTARSVWLQLGLPVDAGDGPIQQNFGRSPVRLNADSDGEVVWGQRLCPVRVRIENVPLPDSGFRYGDIVLHDGAPVGTRVSGDREYGVFNVLELFESSPVGTYEVRLNAEDAGDVEALADLCEQGGIAFEDWTASVRQLCRACSEGRPHQHHDQDGDDAHWSVERRVALAAISGAAIAEALERWGSPRRQVVSCYLALPGAAQ
jgi:tetratricopeptide (TPR) repeat protein